MAIPIVFIHLGESYYLKYSINQAKHTNPDSQLFIITDIKQNLPEFVKQLDIKKYFSDAEQFQKGYIHISINSYKHELFCFQRWFVLNEMCKEQKLKEVLMIDSDILLYVDVNKIFKRDFEYKFTVTKKISPHVTYFPDTNNLDEYCGFLKNLYSSEIYKKKMEEKYGYHLANNVAGGVCYMTAVGYYGEFEKQKLLELSEIFEGARFDDNINESEGYEFDTHLKIKKIIFEDEKPVCINLETKQKIHFNVLHFQGPGKKYLPYFYSYSDLKSERLKDLEMIKKMEQQEKRAAIIHNIKQRVKKILNVKTL
jgi:hypothetical protein